MGNGTNPRLGAPFLTMGVSTIHPMRMATMPPREKRTSLVLKLSSTLEVYSSLNNRMGSSTLKQRPDPTSTKCWSMTFTRINT